MNSAVLGILPSGVRDLVAEIEDYASREIVVAECRQQRVASCYISPDAATIYLPDFGRMTAEDILHELLHIRRYWNLGVPQLMAKNRRSQPHVDAIGSIDNQLEHLVIVPEQAAFGFDAYDRWNRRESREWNDRFWESIGNAEDRRLNLLLSYLTVSIIVTDPGVKTTADQVLNSLGIFRDGQDFVGEVRNRIGDKTQVAASAKRFLPLRDSDAELVRFDVRGGREDSFPIP
jgi:hypothetical protein